LVAPISRWFLLAAALFLGSACQGRPDVPASCSSAVCLGGEVEHHLTTALPSPGEAGKVVLVEEGPHGTALVGLVGQGERGRLVGLAMVSIDELKGQEIVVPVGAELRFGEARLWSIEEGQRRELRTGELRFTVDTTGRQLQGHLRGAPGESTEIRGRYRLECKVPEAVLNVQHRGVNAPGSETYTGDPGLDSDFCQKFRALR
jgi:hypothetical protein